ncbi:hypothetical protein C8A01DRAFT_37395 [Parachaetomium inaequale]|uniref:Heterokaryon incompatibility domain-containing protein n=1 Tax=Parachaetomium inaequale TaxID=2588326 RepID=A0AAN6PG61_9PEZI|nr:hypothetical protein C8A01DRAFT_37395 [Parachaetomium inaequale]
MATNQDRYAQLKTSTVLSDLGQRLVTLSGPNKDALLSEATKAIHSDESRARAAAILTRLGELNPELAQQFQPKQDALTDLNLRMICSTASSDFQSNAENVASFIAVSYCWHNDHWPLPPAAAPLSKGWEVSEPMMNAVMGLPTLRQSPDEEPHVWLDKLCINQGDQADIHAHLGVMDTIYRTARRVVILLEDVQLDKDEEQAGLAFAGFYEDLCREVKDKGLEGQEKGRFVNDYFPSRIKDLDEGTLAAAKPFAIKMLGARWYSRAWCAHESRMMKHQKVNNPLFLCFGSDGRVLPFEFRFVHYLGLYLSDSEPEEELTGAQLKEWINDPDPKSLRQLWWRIQRLMPDSDPNASAMQHLVSLLSFGCFKKGDLMSIALNTAGIPLSYAGEDIQCVEDVIWKFSLLVLAAGDLVPLVSSGEKLTVPTTGGNIVSWIIKPDQGVLDEKLPNPLPESITGLTREYIELDLLVFESPPKQASPGSQEKATRLIAEHNLNSIGDEMLDSLEESTQSVIRLGGAEMMRINPRTPPLPTLRHRLLSMALDNGLDWLLAFPSAMEQTTSSFMHGTLGTYTNPTLMPAANSLLALFNTTSTTPEQTEEATLALTTLLDPRFHLLTPSPRTLSLSPALGGPLLTTAPSNRSYVAIPTCLAHLPAWHDRAWAIEPFDPTAEPEKLSDLLPVPDLHIAKDGEKEEKIEDVIPVLTSDYEDRRAGMDTAKGVWRMRRRQVLFGGCEGLWGVEGKGMMTVGDERLVRGGEGVVLLRRQRVYGGEDYPWKEIHEVVRRVFGVGGGGAGVSGVNDIS